MSLPKDGMLVRIEDGCAIFIAQLVGVQRRVHRKSITDGKLTLTPADMEAAYQGLRARADRGQPYAKIMQDRMVNGTKVVFAPCEDTLKGGST